MALPDTYQEVEYIETTGTQFINTGLYVGNNIQVETKIAVNSISQPQIVFACYRTSGSDDLPNYYGLAAYQNRWYYGLNGSELNGGAYSPTIGTEYKIVYNNANNYININGSDVLNCSGTAGYTGTTLGIAVRANRNLSGSFKYYYFRMYNKATGAYERDFVPCYRKSDKKPGLYDLVNNTFYTNQGTGEFTYKEYAESGKITHRYIGTKQVRPSGWQPNENTILYLPFKTDLLDHSQTGLILTNSGGVTISDGAAYFNGSNYLYSKAFTQINQSNFTASVWFKNTSNTNSERVCLHQFSYNSGYRGYFLGITGTELNAQNTYIKTRGDVSITVTVNERHNLILVRDSTNQTSQFYFDGQAIPMKDTNNYPELYGWLGIGGGMWYNSTTGEYKWIGYMSNIIYENKAWTSEEVSNYYNQTKSKYGL